jgi:hypothetical protein
MTTRTVSDLIQRDRAIYETSDSGIVLKNPHKFISQTLDLLVWNAVLGETEEFGHRPNGSFAEPGWNWELSPHPSMASTKHVAARSAAGSQCPRLTCAD